MPMLPWYIDRPDTIKPSELPAATALLSEMAEEAGRPRPEVVVGLDFDPKAPEAVPERLGILREAGVDGIVTGAYFETAAEFRSNLEFFSENILESE